MVKIFKMIDGDDIIASVEKTTKENITLKMPVRIGMTAQGVAMMPWCPFVENDLVTIRREHIIFEAPVDIQVANAYNEKFGSGIVTATAIPNFSITQD
jgi:hypothetical protein